MKSLVNSEDRRSIESRIAAVHVNSPRQWGRMTPHQMLMHLYDSYRVPMGEFQVSPKPMPSIIKWIALSVPLRWPKGSPTRPELDQSLAGTKPGDFAYDRDLLLTVIDRFCKADMSRFAKHPNFGSLTPAEWMRWGYLHADHHLRQFGT